ncbi:MAG: hypothetical protein CM1200mP28_03460 [Deltaproteobacteria bacterium]|nr:MAG: hypothetical protein CM1200mP28_03460 [Deltaproteobacteria bacterium]
MKISVLQELGDLPGETAAKIYLGFIQREYQVPP